MLNSIIRSSLANRLLVIVLAGALIAGGFLGMRRMPVDVLPEFSAPYVEIQTEALGLSADEVEQLITVPMEQDLLNGVPWLQTIQSQSVAGLSSIVMVFEPGTDLYRARQMVSERMTQAFALPHVSKPPSIIQPVSSASRFMIVGLSSKTLSLIEMSVLARWTIVPRLMGVPGVANVAVWGNRDRQLQVQVDPARLQEKNISLLQVLETTGNALWVSSLSFVEASTPGTGGFIDTAQQRLGIRHISPIVTSDSLAQVPIEDTGVRLGDVADVVEDHQPLIGDALTNDGTSLLLVIQKFPGANTLNVTKGVEDALDELRPGMTGLDMNSDLFRPVDFIYEAERNLGLALLIGFLLIALALTAFFFEWRRVVVSLVVIPLSLLTAGWVLQLRGATFSGITLAGMIAALAIIIDDAVVDVEAMARRLEQRDEGSSMTVMETLREASLAMRSPLIYAMLISLLAAVPFYFMGGSSSAFFRPLAISYGLAVAASMLLALTVTPALTMMLMGKGAGRVSARATQLRSAYASVLERMNGRGRLALILVVILTLVGLAVLPGLKQRLIPSFRERSLLVHLDGAPGASQPESSRIAGRVSAELESIPGVQTVAAQIGRAIFGDQVVNVNSSDLWVTIAPSADYESTVSAIQKVVNGYPGVNHSVQTYLSERTSGVAASAPTDSMTVRLYGDNDAGLRSSAADLATTIAGVKGVSEAQVKLPAQQPTFEIEVNLAAAQKYGLKPGDVRRAAATMFSGIQVGALFQEQKVFDVVVWSTPATRESVSSIRDLQIDTPSGGRVRLGDVADVRVVPGVAVVRHEQVKRYVDIAVKVDGRSLGAVAADITAQLRQTPLPLEYHAAVLGGYAERQAILNRFLTFAGIALLGMFLLLQAALKNWRLALGVLVVLPAALSGGTAAAYLAGGTISLGSLAGLLGLTGITVRYALTLFSHYIRKEQEEGKAFNSALVLEGAQDRMLPMLASRAATGLGLAAALFFGSMPGLELIMPLAVVMIGGLVSTTLVDIFVLPALYLRFGASREADLGLSPVGMADMPPTAAD